MAETAEVRPFVVTDEWILSQAGIMEVASSEVRVALTCSGPPFSNSFKRSGATHGLGSSSKGIGNPERDASSSVAADARGPIEAGEG